MANTLYDAARQRFLEAQINWMTDTVKVLLVDTGAYTPQTAVHQYLSDISGSARIAGQSASVAVKCDLCRGVEVSACVDGCLDIARSQWPHTSHRERLQRPQAISLSSRFPVDQGYRKICPAGGIRAGAARAAQGA